MKKTPSLQECRDTGLALSFVALLLWWFSARPAYVYSAMIIILATMIWPGFMSYPARLWFGLSHLLGSVMNQLILGLLFFLIVLSVALIRKALGKDAMGFKQWKNSKVSAFVVRDHTYVAADLKDTF